MYHCWAVSALDLLESSGKIRILCLICDARVSRHETIEHAWWCPKVLLLPDKTLDLTNGAVEGLIPETRSSPFKKCSVAAHGQRKTASCVTLEGSPSIFGPLPSPRRRRGVS